MTMWKPRSEHLRSVISAPDKTASDVANFLSPYDIPTLVQSETATESQWGNMLRVRFRYLQPDEPARRIEIGDGISARVGDSGRIYEVVLPLRALGRLGDDIQELISSQAIEQESKDEKDFAEIYSKMISHVVRRSAKREGVGA